jgi:hypothetical protein
LGGAKKIWVSQFLSVLAKIARFFRLQKKMVYTGFKLAYHRALRKERKVENDLRE